MSYTLRNESDREITRVHASFFLYDATGLALALPGGNRFEITCEVALAPGEEAEFCTSLDSSIYYAPEGGLSAEQFHIHDVEFADGGSWHDTLGLYLYPYPLKTRGAGES